MVLNVHAAFSPLFIAASFVGLSVLEYPAGTPRPYFSGTYIVIFWTIHLYFLRYLTWTLGDTGIFKGTATIYITYSNVATAVFSSFLYLYYNEKFRTCMKKLDAVLDTLDKLGVKKDLGRIHTITQWLIAIWVITACALNGLDSVRYSFYIDNVFFTLVTFIFNYAIHVNTVSDMMFGMILLFIKSKFESINELIQNMTNDIGTNRKQIWRTPTRSILTHRTTENVRQCRNLLWVLMHVHTELRKIAGDINTIFGIQMVLQMITTFVFLTGLIYELYIWFLTHYNHFNEAVVTVALILLWNVLYFTKLILINCTCEYVSGEANRTERHVQNFFNTTYDVKLQKEIKAFVIQLAHNELQFTGQGFFSFGYVFLQTFVSSLTTFLVILIQMYDPSKASGK